MLLDLNSKYRRFRTSANKSRQMIQKGSRTIQEIWFNYKGRPESLQRLNKPCQIVVVHVKHSCQPKQCEHYITYYMLIHWTITTTDMRSEPSFPKTINTLVVPRGRGAPQEVRNGFTLLGSTPVITPTQVWIHHHCTRLTVLATLL